MISDKVRVRFAPSPTGYLHVGGLRTALFNFLFARHHGGYFILRIEDTDRTRYVPGAEENLIKTLRWTGLDYDEGPGVGGPYGPYRQSQRLDLYAEHARRLVEEGHAYYCFCTPERLEAMRQEQIRRKEPPMYDGTCRKLSRQEAEERKKAGEPYVVRLKMPRTGETVVEDIIRGKVVFQNAVVDDQVLVKSDGYPTYHLASVVDDHYMRITHVIRGEEWLPSVPKHIQLYRAFGWEVPQMAHLPLLLNPDRSKLSKRQGDVAVEDYIRKGYLPQALINFVALLGWNPGTEQEIFTLEELIQQFSLERIHKAGAVFDIQKLNWLNGYYIRQLPEDQLIAFLTPFLERAGYDVSDREKTRKIILAVYKGIDKGEDIAEAARLFYDSEVKIEEPEAREMLAQPSTRTVLETFLQKLDQVEGLDLETFKVIMKEIQQETGIKKKALWMPLRIALTGLTHGPELPLVIDIFGKAEVRRRIKYVLDTYLASNPEA
ncbi:MAG: glutamate--tRNA ligase [Calditrichaeota bacterium]|nr:MAG: glutamate--tRNA ligase [Calditrichota bacterium]